jgi:hypothetical protein
MVWIDLGQSTLRLSVVRSREYVNLDYVICHFDVMIPLLDDFPIVSNTEYEHTNLDHARKTSQMRNSFSIKTKDYISKTNTRTKLTNVP